MSRPALTILVAIALVPALAGCLGSTEDPVKLQRQARAALVRWADTIGAAGGQTSVVVAGELSGQVGDWEAAVGDNNKRALMAEMVDAPSGLSSEVPPDGVVRWQDGRTASVPLMSAQAAVAALQAGPDEPCSECRPLRIASARLTTGPVETTRGPATAPVWEYGLEGTAVKLTRVAIADAISVGPAPWNANDPPIGIVIESASGSATGRELTVAFVGAPPGDQPCGEDYTTDAVESDLAVVVIVTRHPHPALGACTAVGAPRTATVQLAAPLGDRAVLEIQQGRPVPVVPIP